MRIARGGSYECTQACGCAFHKAISALSPVSYGDMCFPVRQSRWRGVVSRVVYLGKGEYRRDIDARKFSYSRPAYISMLWRRRVAETAPQRRTEVYMCNPERSVLGDAVHSLPNVRFRNLWDTRFARLTHHSICVAHFDTSLCRLICDGDISVPYSLTLSFALSFAITEYVIWRTDLGCPRRLLSRFIRVA